MKYLKLFEDYNSDDNEIDSKIELIINNTDFINWFGDSVMVDSNNRPILFYHGSKNKFDIFDKNKIGTATDAGWLGEGFYFYTEYYEAIQYGEVSTFFLKIENPYYASIEDNRRLSKLNSKKASKKFSENLINEGYDGVYYNEDLRGETVVFEPTQIWKIS